MHDVFLSYATPDKAFADAACHALESAGVRVWVAPRDVDPGAPYGRCITEAIKASTLMVVVFSKDANASEHVAREVELAARDRKPLLPVRIDPIEPSSELLYFMGRAHWLDALTAPVEAHLGRLVGAVEKLLGRSSAPVPQSRAAQSQAVGGVALTEIAVSAGGRGGSALRWGFLGTSRAILGLAVGVLGLLIVGSVTMSGPLAGTIRSDIMVLGVLCLLLAFLLITGAYRRARARTVASDAGG